MDFSTRCIHGTNKQHDSTGAVSVPIYQSATFAHPAVGETTGFDYTRLQNPTREHLEKTVANLEGGIDCLAFTSGMAAISALMELLKPGDHIIASDDLYGGSYRLFSHISAKNGIEITFVDAADLTKLQNAISKKTKLIFIETPTNPMMKVTDIKAVSELAKQQGLLLAVDNTFLTPYFQKPLSLGADIVVHSGTKYLGGHNDTLAGFLVVGEKGLSERLCFIQKTIGSALSPFDSWLLIRGIKTLSIRLERQQETAFLVAGWLKTQPKVKAVYYAGLPEHMGYEVSKKQSTGFGGMISLVTDSELTAKKVLSSVRLIQFAESLGGVETLITYPLLQTHADIPEEKRKSSGINECLLRLSVGLESPKDLIADLDKALNG